MEQFACLLRCTICNETYSVAGATRYYEVGEDPSYFDLSQSLKPRYIEPAPQIFPIPKRYPKEAKKELLAAFSLFWPDPGAALNRLRTSLELYLDEKRVQRKARKKNGKYRDLSLHERIQRFAANHPEINDKMLAVKWLGNVGSHESSVTRREALEAFELLDYILEEVVDGRRSRLTRMAQSINTAKGRVKVKPPF